MTHPAFRPLARLLPVLGAALFLLVAPLWAVALKEKSLIPSMVLCGLKHDGLHHILRGEENWSYDLDGPVLDVQAQPLRDHYLVTGGKGRVCLVRRVWKGCRILWDWSRLEDVRVVDAVAADWDETGAPSLILAADAQNKRLFLAEAKSRGIKIRWQFELPAVPLRVHLCTDTGNFLAVLADDSIEEVHFQRDQVVERLGKEQGLKDPRDAVRDPWARTYVADAGTGDVLCFGPHLEPVWKTHMPFAPGDFQEMSLSLFRKKGKRLLLVAVRFATGPSRAPNVVYVLDTENGKVVDWSDRMKKGGYPDFSRAVPDKAEYYKKQ